MEVLSVMKSAAEEKTSPVPPVQRGVSNATTIPATAEELAAMGRKATHFWHFHRNDHVLMHQQAQPS